LGHREERIKPIETALEEGEKKTFATAVEWPGWSRSGRDEASALQALVDYAPRYARVMQIEGIAFPSPAAPADLTITARVTGNSSTNFGVPNIPLPGDDAPVSAEELARLESILRACWRYFADTLKRAEGKSLRMGPRGGGRDVEKMVSHVVNAEYAYLSKLGSKRPNAAGGDPVAQVQAVSLAALAASVHGELPKQGPRGGKVWPARVYARRSAWHILDHAWEIEDRM
jgi:hypothetical protein